MLKINLMMRGAPHPPGRPLRRWCWMLLAVPKKKVGEFDIPGSRLDLDNIGQGHHQGGIGPAFAKGIDGDDQVDGEG